MGGKDGGFCRLHRASVDWREGMEGPLTFLSRGMGYHKWRIATPEGNKAGRGSIYVRRGASKSRCCCTWTSGARTRSVCERVSMSRMMGSGNLHPAVCNLAG